jgi:regulatory protein YycH of two-component signal transduction system YycFG
MSSLFADRILNLAVTGNLVRLEMGASKVAQSANGAQVLEPAFTLVMPLDGFVQSVDVMNTVVNQLVVNNIVIRPQTIVSDKPQGPAH